MKKILKNIKNWIINDKKIIMLSISVGIVATIGATTYTKIYAESIQANIAGKVIRFHVLANSNTEVDQSLKLKVRDEILLNYTDELENCKDVDESRKLINENINGIEAIANKVIKESGFNYIAKASLEKTDFPTKYYGNVSFPPGEYEALRIEIGEAEGENWWCVMFPPLCFVDITQGNQVVNTKPVEKPITKKTDSIQMPITYTTSLKNVTTKTENIEPTVFTEKEEYKNDFYDIKEETQQETEDYSYYYDFYNIEKNDYTKETIVKDKYTDTTKVVSEEEKGNISEKSKEILKSTLEEDEYNLVTNETEEIVPIKVKFKVVEFWQNMKINKNVYVKK